MGMTIERAIDVIDHRYAIMDYVEDEALSAALEIAITNMQMVDKIKRIYNSWRTGNYKDSTECMQEIGELLDGKYNH